MRSLHCFQRSISIHAPHARSDFIVFLDSCVYIDFNPRSSCEERLKTVAALLGDTVFHSTRLMRGATRSCDIGARK